MNPQDAVKERSWYAFYTVPRAEKKVLERLSSKRIEAFLPLHRQLRQWSDRKKWVEEPLFNGYVFVRITPREYQQAIETAGVVRCVTFNGRLARIPDWQIEDIRRLLSAQESFEIVSEIKPGDPVVVVDGPLAGMNGELVGFRGSQRVAVRIDNIGQVLLVQVQQHCIRRKEAVLA